MKDKRGDEWFPFWVDKWLFGSTRHEFTHAQRAIWVDVLTLSKKDGGFIRANEGVPYPVSQLAGMFKAPTKLVEDTIRKAIETGKLQQMPDGTLFVVSTLKYTISDRHRRRLEKSFEKPSMSENPDIVSESADPLSRARVYSTSTSSPKESITLGGCRGEIVWTIEQVKDACVLLGIPEQHAQSYLDHYGSQGWKKANGQLITELRGHMKKRWTGKGWDFDEKKGKEAKDVSPPVVRDAEGKTPADRARERIEQLRKAHDDDKA